MKFANSDDQYQLVYALTNFKLFKLQIMQRLFKLFVRYFEGNETLYLFSAYSIISTYLPVIKFSF